MYKKLTAELLGTFILVFAGTGAIMINDIADSIRQSILELTPDRKNKETKGRKIIENYYSETIMLNKYK